MKRKKTSRVWITLFFIIIVVLGYFWLKRDSIDQNIIQPTAKPQLVITDKGLLSGNVSFLGKTCDLKDPRIKNIKTPPCSGIYKGYEVIVYKEDGKTVFTKTLTDGDGNYTLLLNPGKYVIYAQSGLSKSNLEVHNIIVQAGTSITEDLVIQTNIR